MGAAALVLRAHRDRRTSTTSEAWRFCVSFLDSTALDELARRLADSVPESLRAFGRDLEGNFKAVLQAQLSRLDLVSRQEFDVQAALLRRTQEKLAALDKRLQELERKP